uniref:Uncharacterized protein n=1 Tax=Promethearchaeum syntrophicum TaxID=2594042 RepID=A0A5B9D8I1_9ARCH|nr:hypothetical protein DSAG12_01217 [Candidatus Prometheoarchaeum syntrophicum]
MGKNKIESQFYSPFELDLLTEKFFDLFIEKNELIE